MLWFKDQMMAGENVSNSDTELVVTFKHITTTTPILWPLFQDNQDKLVPERQNHSRFE